MEQETEGFYSRARLVSERKTLWVYTKVLCSAGEIACEGHPDFYLGSDGGFIVAQQNNHFEIL